eukprot:scaffold13704_cov102-Isochrysis_galbana.AAC.3
MARDLFLCAAMGGGWALGLVLLGCSAGSCAGPCGPAQGPLFGFGPCADRISTLDHEGSDQ